MLRYSTARRNCHLLATVGIYTTSTTS